MLLFFVPLVNSCNRATFLFIYFVVRWPLLYRVYFCIFPVPVFVRPLSLSLLVCFCFGQLYFLLHSCIRATFYYCFGCAAFFPLFYCTIRHSCMYSSDVYLLSWLCFVSASSLHSVCGRRGASIGVEDVAASGTAPLRRPRGRAGVEGGATSEGARGGDRAGHGGIRDEQAAVEV